jgi:hypothetical protein
MAKRLTWQQKLQTPQAGKLAVLEKSFAGLDPGKLLWISTPAEISAYIQNIPIGQTRSVAALREDLAHRHGADATCPLTTGIFLRIVAEATWEQMNAGLDPDQAVPFWRVVDPASPLAKKLSCGPAFAEKMRAAELPR